jgi:hypothetical protein
MDALERAVGAPEHSARRRVWGQLADPAVPPPAGTQRWCRPPSTVTQRESGSKGIHDASVEANVLEIPTVAFHLLATKQV